MRNWQPIDWNHFGYESNWLSFKPEICHVHSSVSVAGWNEFSEAIEAISGHFGFEVCALVDIEFVYHLWWYAVKAFDLRTRFSLGCLWSDFDKLHSVETWDDFLWCVWRFYKGRGSNSSSFVFNFLFDLINFVICFVKLL